VLESPLGMLEHHDGLPQSLHALGTANHQAERSQRRSLGLRHSKPVRVGALVFGYRVRLVATAER
jgi:hypothetical protein